VSFAYRSLFDIPYSLFESCRIVERNAGQFHLSRGLISGHWRRENIAPGDFRAHSPRFQGTNVDANLALVEALGSVHVALAASDLAAIEVAVPKDSAAGARYPSAAMADLDSEK